MTYPLELTTCGMFTCNAVSNADYGDGLDRHPCPDFETIQEVLDWLSDNSGYLE